jgi:GNAT superfamily N-acetyltransferase
MKNAVSSDESRIHAQTGKKMDTISFCVMTDLEHREEVVAMMRLLYEEDKPASEVDYARFPSTIDYLVSNPCAGKVVLFRSGHKLTGYALLVPYWSNELGGTLLCIDELFVISDCRSRGIGRRFFRYLEQQRPYGPVALALGVSPENHRARRLYESLGFVEQRNATLTRHICLNPA